MKKWISMLMLFIGLGTAMAQNGKIQSLSVNDFEKAIKQKKVQLVDVRTPEEFKSGHIKGALNIDVKNPDFDNQILKLKKKSPVAVYCRSGHRSKIAAQKLSEKGFAVIELDRGFNDWTGQGKPVEK
ncbi:rhodanese-like domain-containing protein [Parabacteroides sp. FAFU027]|uniref:rhodanese-like domain-containing protein n=1 Tax=Parabacteroides sp. FAFU027 TaxID=2922715 RepID=UPI001FB04605|nr:rhodanese-like domain-containing protein [Parabacteroides sp. FAFU027]